MQDWILIFFVIGAVGTLLAHRYALRASLIDQPGERRSHAMPTPRGGGIAIVVAVLSAVVALAFRAQGQGVLLAAFGVGFGAIAWVGWIDDHRPLSARLRLAVHVAGALVFAGTFGALTDQWLWACIGFALIVVLTNVWNFMDGIDGIATTQALLVGSALSVVAPGAWSGLAIALVGACAGFLPFNWPRARIFMGDVGSGAVGFAIGALVLVECTRTTESNAIANVLWLLPLSAFLVDASMTLVRRIVRGEPWWTAHAQHAYQVAARRFGHPRVTLAYVAWTLASVLVAWALYKASPVFMLVSVMAWYTAAALAWGFVQTRVVPDSPRATSMKDSG